MFREPNKSDIIFVTFKYESACFKRETNLVEGIYFILDKQDSKHGFSDSRVQCLFGQVEQQPATVFTLS